MPLIILIPQRLKKSFKLKAKEENKKKKGKNLNALNFLILLMVEKKSLKLKAEEENKKKKVRL